MAVLRELPAWCLYNCDSACITRLMSLKSASCTLQNPTFNIPTYYNQTRNVTTQNTLHGTLSPTSKPYILHPIKTIGNKLHICAFFGYQTRSLCSLLTAQCNYQKYRASWLYNTYITLHTWSFLDPALYPAG